MGLKLNCTSYVYLAESFKYPIDGKSVSKETEALQ